MAVHRPDSLNAAAWLIALLPAITLADMATDGTMGPAVQLSGPDMTIGADLGQTRGNNLFHSFHHFNIPTDQQATFSGPSHIQNVVSRVTGGEVSKVDGTLRSTVGQADVYLINPSGVVMGPNAKVDVPAALHIGTADELRFSDGSRFSARDPKSSTLTSAAPEAFGFLTPQPASLRLDSAQLDLKPGQSATLTAGDIALVGTAERPAKITASGGTVRLETVGNTQIHIPVDKPSSKAIGGHVQLDHAQIDTSGEHAGRLTIRAGSATLTQESALDTAHGGTTAATGGIDISITGAMQMSAGSRITADALGDGRGGSIRVATGTLNLNDGSRITAAVHEGGDTGTITVQTNALNMNGLNLSSTANTVIGTGSWVDHRPDAGAAGDVSVAVRGRLDLSEGAIISSGALVGDAGALIVKADELQLAGKGTTIVNATWGSGEFGSGKIGALTVDVSGLLELHDGAVIENGTLIGETGDLSIKAGELRLASGGSSIYTAAWGMGSPEDPGRVGALTIDIAGLLEMREQTQIASFSNVSGDAGAIRIRANSLRMLGASTEETSGVMIGSHAEHESTGYAGTVQLEIDGNLEMQDAMISSLAKGPGDGGVIDIRAQNVFMGAMPELGDGDTMQMILTQSRPEASGNAGNIHLEVADRLELEGSSWISSTSMSSGNAGDITVRANALRIDGQFNETDGAGIFGDVEKDWEAPDQGVTGQVGSIDITADQVRLLNHGKINVAAHQSPDTPAMDQVDSRVRIVARLLELDGGYIDANTNGPVAAAAIEIQADQLHLANGAQVNTNTSGSGSAGHIGLSARSITLDGFGTQITSSTLAGSGGNAGQLTIRVADTLALSDQAWILTDTSGMGAAGSIDLQAHNLSLIDGASITSHAEEQSGGPVGNIAISAQRLALLNSAEISIDARQTLAPDRLAQTPLGQIMLSVDDFTLNDATLSARSHGNVPASAIVIHSKDTRLTDSAITTDSLLADAGPIRLQGGLAWLTDGQITTSANGPAGDGGDINLNVDHLILDGGFIQANTAAVGASGGDIRIDTRTIISNQNQLTVGGAERQSMVSGSGYNVIQAAAPGGEQGNILVTAPAFDITASLVPLATPFQDPDALLADLCRTVSGPQANSLVERGFGGLAPGPDAPASLYFAGERLDRIQRLFFEK